MAWRRPPKIPLRGLKTKPTTCPENAASGGSGAGAAGGSGRRSLSQPKHQVEPKPRRNPKEVREAALAKKTALQNKSAQGGPRGGGAPRVRTTVTKSRSTPGGGDETTIVERVQSGSAAVYKPRYNRKKVLHPADVYTENKRQPPKKPAAPCPTVKRGEYYSKEVVGLWEQWQQWNEFKEEVKCWKQNVPYLNKKEREDKAFNRWLQKEEEMHERLYKAGKSKIMPFHMRPEPKEKKPAGRVKSPQKRVLKKTPEGKKRYEQKDCFGNYVRYNSVDDPNPEDLYNAQGQDPPQYVQPPLREDGTFKLPKERTEEETEAFMAYRKWEEFYFRQQAWDTDKKWVGDPRIDELWKMGTPRGTPRGGAVADMSSAQGRAEARAAERAGRKAVAEQKRREKMTRAEKETEANLKKMGMKNKLSGAARVAMQAAAKREAAVRAAEEAKIAERQNRSKSFLKRGQRCAPAVSGRGKIDVSRVQSRIGGMIRAGRERAAQEAAAAEAAAAEAVAASPPAPVDEYIIPPPPEMPYEVYERNLQSDARRRQSQAFCERMTNQMVRHLNLSGQMGHTPTSVRFYDVGERPPPVRGSDVAILNYDPRTPPASLFGGPSGDVEDEELGCDEPSAGWFDPDEPVSPFGKTYNYMKHPSPPKSISKGRLPHHPMHPNDAMRMQYDMNEDEFWFAEQELECLDDKAYRDYCAQEQMNRPLRERAAAMAAQTDIDLLHPSVFRSNLMQRQRETGLRQYIASELDNRAQVMQAQPLPCVRARPVTRVWNVPTPPASPMPSPSPSPPRYQDLLAIDEPPCSTPPPPGTPPLAYTPPRRATPPRPGSPFLLPERFAGGVNPFLERARAAIEEPCAHVPFRGDEIAAQAARTAAAAQPRRRPDIFGAWDTEDFAADMQDQAYLDQALEGVQLSPTEAAQHQQWQWPDYSQCQGPQYGALYHEHIRQPQLGPWHYTPPGGRTRRHFNWDNPPVANLVDLGIPQVAPRRARRRNLHGLRPPNRNLCF